MYHAFRDEAENPVSPTDYHREFHLVDITLGPNIVIFFVILVQRIFSWKILI